MVEGSVSDDGITAPQSRNAPCPCGSGKRYKSCHGSTAPHGIVEPDTKSAGLHSLMHSALAAQQSNRLEEAENLYREALLIDPAQSDCLHMLGVVRLMQFDPLQAEMLIKRAGDLSAWQSAELAHNYAVALTALTSARENLALTRHAAQIRQQRCSAAEMNPAVPIAFDVVVVAEDENEDAAASLASVDALPQATGRVLLLTPAPGAASVATAPTVRRWDANDPMGTLRAAIAHCESPFVVILRAGDVVDTAVVNGLAALANSGAGWGFGRASLRPDVTDPSTSDLWTSRFQAIESEPCFGAALLADGEVCGQLGNVLWRREFLAARLAELPTGVAELLDLALWQDEPMFVDSTLCHFQRRVVTARFWRTVERGSADRFLERALTEQEPGNPLAPCMAVGGLGFLQRPLRLGLGRRVSLPMLQRLGQLLTRSPVTAPLRTDGIEMIGFVRAAIGLGESIRLLAHSCRQAQVPFALADFPLASCARQIDHQFDDELAVRPTFRTRLICTNPDLLAEANFIDGAANHGEAYEIGYWYWELERLPPSWRIHGELIDELWVATDFVAAAAAKNIDRPIMKMPPPILPPEPKGLVTRSEFGLDNSDIVFMFSFDFGSYPARKNPEAVIRAFRLAFASCGGAARLLIKCHRGETQPAAQQRVRQLAAGDSRIRLLEETLTRQQLVRLQASIDCFVSLHRSEGFGLGMAECMALGKPVIATGYSGNLDFMHERNSLLVDYSLVPVQQGEYVDWQQQRWAEPDIEQAAAHMRRIYEDRTFAKALGERGRQTILQDFSVAVVAQRPRRRLDVINSQLAGGMHVTSRVRRSKALGGRAHAAMNT